MFHSGSASVESERVLPAGEPTMARQTLRLNPAIISLAEQRLGRSGSWGLVVPFDFCGPTVDPLQAVVRRLRFIPGYHLASVLSWHGPPASRRGASGRDQRGGRGSSRGLGWGSSPPWTPTGEERTRPNFGSLLASPLAWGSGSARGLAACGPPRMPRMAGISALSYGAIQLPG